ncbi:unnamed protein product, partial [Rotaria magnacalcarata]
QNENVTNVILCNCPVDGTFGKYCEYKFPMDSKSLEEAIQNQRMQKRQFVLGSQIFGVILCYEPSFQCDYGLLCLDWCNICDHKQNCADGADEEHCEFLEFHECELNEYRCGNGACIDRSYLLDGEMDCMDGTDEKNAYDLLRSRDCPFVVDHFGCDEMVFHPMYFSCGDGQFILEEQRYIQGNGKRECFTNTADEYMKSLNIHMSAYRCNDRDIDATHCKIIKAYFLNLTEKISVYPSAELQMRLESQIHFRQYCDSFWDLEMRRDEIPELCKKYWKCSPDEYQCKTFGECIPLSWVCNNVWDCSDASDEQGIFIIQKLSAHNELVMDLNVMKNKCFGLYSAIQPYTEKWYYILSDKLSENQLCNIMTAYSCFRNGPSVLDDAFNINSLSSNILNAPPVHSIKITTKPCIPLKKIGDGIPDCYGGIDERNTVSGCTENTMQGYDFHCHDLNLNNASANSAQCIPYSKRCSDRCMHGHDRILCESLKCVLLCPRLRSPKHSQDCKIKIEEESYFRPDSYYYCDSDATLGLSSYRENAKRSRPLPSICLSSFPQENEPTTKIIPCINTSSSNTETNDSAKQQASQNNPLEENIRYYDNLNQFQMSSEAIY